MGPPPKKTVCIVGAGIAGCTLALQLLSHPRLAEMYRPILLDALRDPFAAGSADDKSEKERRVRTSGAVGLFANGLHPLYKLGLQQEIEAKSRELTGVKIWRAAYGKRPDSPGKVTLVNGPSDDRSESPQRYLPKNSRHMAYDELQRLLVRAVVQRGGEVRWGERVGQFDDLGSGVTKVHLKDGSTVLADLLVGADGYSSMVGLHILQLLNPHDPNAYVRDGEEPETAIGRWVQNIADQTIIYGTSTGFALKEGDERMSQTQVIMLDSGYLTTAPLPEGKIHWGLVLPYKGSARKGERDDKLYLSQSKMFGWETVVHPGPYPLAKTVELLKKHVGVYHPVTGTFGRLLETCDLITRTHTHQLAWKVEEIQHGSMVLIGDASRTLLPCSEQSPGFAVEDATVLAGALLRFPYGHARKDGFRAALEYYAGERVPRSQRMASCATSAAKLALGTRWLWKMARTNIVSWPLWEAEEYKRTSASEPWPTDARINVE